MSQLRRHQTYLLRLTFTTLLLLGMGFTAGRTFAQTPPHGRTRPKPAVRGKKNADAGADAAVTPTSGRKTNDDAGSEAVTQKTLDGGSKVFRFGELEIEGRLKNPQLVFFLRRVRAEFAAGDLGHRSFLRELHETKLDPQLLTEAHHGDGGSSTHRSTSRGGGLGDDGRRAPDFAKGAVVRGR